MNSSSRLSSLTMDEVCDALDGVTGSGAQRMAQCPCHDDGTPSLSLTEENGKVLWHCHAHCDRSAVTAAILSRLGIPRTDNGNGNSNGSAKRKGPPPGTPITATHVYKNADGTVAMYRDRYEWFEHGKRQKAVYPRQLDGARKGTPNVPYNLPAINDAIRDAYPVVFVEGEKAADAITARGYNAVTTTGGATSWKPKFAEFFRGARVLFWPDADDA